MSQRAPSSARCHKKERPHFLYVDFGHISSHTEYNRNLFPQGKSIRLALGRSTRVIKSLLCQCGGHPAVIRVNNEKGGVRPHWPHEQLMWKKWFGRFLLLALQVVGHHMHASSPQRGGCMSLVDCPELERCDRQMVSRNTGIFARCDENCPQLLHVLRPHLVTPTTIGTRFHKGSRFIWHSGDLHAS